MRIFPSALNASSSAEQRVVLDLLHARVVNLPDVDVVGVEALQRLFEREAHELGREVLRDLVLALAFAAVIVQVVAELRREHDLVAPVAERLRELLLAASVAVGIGRVEQRDPQVERLVQQRDGLASVISPHQPVEVVQRPKPTSLTVMSVFG